MSCQSEEELVPHTDGFIRIERIWQGEPVFPENTGEFAMNAAKGGVL